jgi:serine/threonine-protein kinase
MSDPKQTRRDSPSRLQRVPEREAPPSYEPVPSARAPLGTPIRENDTVRDLRPAFFFDREHTPPEPLPETSQQRPTEATTPGTPKTTQTPSGQLLRPGEVFKGKYRIVSVLNVGNLARVYHAKQLPAERDVALKVLLTRYANRPEMRHAMEKEGTELSRVQHPAIVTIHDIGTDDQGVWIVTEFLDGETTRKALKREKLFALERTVAIVLQVATAVAAAHERGIIHGDLKPENVFLKEDNVKVVDFLTARILTIGEDDAMRDEFAYATAEYAAPECFDQDGDPDARSDIYSLAIVFIELVTGLNPMLPDGKPAADALLQLRQRDFSPPVPPQIPLPLAQVIRRALEKKPGKRQQSMRTFATELERAWKNVLDRSEEVRPTWLDRFRPALPAVGTGTWLGFSIGLLAFVLFETYKPHAEAHAKDRQVESSVPPAPSHLPPAPTSRTAPRASVVEAPLPAPLPSLVPVEHQNIHIAPLKNLAPTTRPKPPPVQSSEPTENRPPETPRKTIF